MATVDLKKRFWREYQNLPEACRKGPMFLALSGGKDSTALAHVALGLRGKLPPLHFLHVNYHLRIPDSDREELFLRKWAKREGVAFHVKQLHPKAKPNNLQDWARRERYQFFCRLILEVGEGSGVVCLAHHQGDQAETILMRLMTGSGLKALGGMRTLEKNGSGTFCFRPFLGVPAKAMATYLNAHHLKFRHDKSNEGDAYLRNRLRHQILPRLEAENPRAVEALIRLGQKARGAQEALEDLARDWLARFGRGQPVFEISRPALDGLPQALRLTVVETLLRGQLKETRSLGKILLGLQNSLSRPYSEQAIPLAQGIELKLSPETIRIQNRTRPFRPPARGKGSKTGTNRKP
jgi:tRNA(Ile)-lysidine synthase